MKNHLRIRALCEGALCVALAQILSFLKLFPDLINGGAVTFAMFPICLYAVRWGLGRGLLAGFALGLLQLIFDGAYAWLPILPWVLRVCSGEKAGAFSRVLSLAAWADLSCITSAVSPSIGSWRPPASRASVLLTMPRCTLWYIMPFTWCPA